MSRSSTVSNRPVGRALVVGTPDCRASAAAVLARLGFQTTEADDPYSALADLCQRPLAYRTVVLCLGGIYREELAFIPVARRKVPHVEIYLAQIDGRAAAVAQASSLGADGLLSDEGLHRFSGPSQTIAPPSDQPLPAAALPAAPATPLVEKPQRRPNAPDSAPAHVARDDRRTFGDAPTGEPILTVDELRALLQDPPLRPASGDQ